MERFLARRYGLVGKNEWEEAQVDAYVALLGDAMERKIHKTIIKLNLIAKK